MFSGKIKILFILYDELPWIIRKSECYVIFFPYNMKDILHVPFNEINVAKIIKGLNGSHLEVSALELGLNWELINGCTLWLRIG